MFAKIRKAMKKEFSLEELEVKAQEVLKSFPQADKVFATLDGNVFVREDRARLHAGKGNVYPFERKGEATQAPAEPTAKLGLTAKEVIEAIAKAESLEALEIHKGDPRKSVVEAFEKKLNELTKTA